MACRLPGKIHSPEDYWDVLTEGKDVVTEINSERWATDFYSHPNKNEPGKTYTFAAGVLDNIDGFDAGFFGISPREADQMDPQQRLLLELSWEAIEDSGVTAGSLSKTECAVYVGIASNDYAHRHSDDLASFDAYTMTGVTASVASNRISYAFDLRGPSVSVDTACSSSLVAVHQACQTLWSGEASTALCGGINMLIHPFPFIGFSKASMLSPDGRCKAFDESGNGYVRSEGAGMLLLKPLAQAESDGDIIHAVIAGSDINCDGSTSSISVPGMETQSALLEKVYRKSGVSVQDISYLEAHGTGTAVGDPLEATALGEIIGKQRAKDNPLPIGSAKTNLGHLETASGMAGLLKGVLALKHQSIPASLHFNTPNKNIDFDDLNLSVVTQNTPLVKQDKPHYIGINSFGFGGANAHVLLEEYKVVGETPALPKKRVIPPLFISAKSPDALQCLAKSYADLLKLESSEYYDIAYSARYHQTRLSHVLAVKEDSTTSIIKQLEDFAETGRAANCVTGNHVNDAKLAFVFTGNGCQWQGMGQSLYDTTSSFRRAFDDVSDALAKCSPSYSLKEELLRDETTSNLALTEIAQPLLFAIQVGIVSYLAEHGVKPSAVLGHSVGEVAAAWAGGALSLEQAAMVIHHRSQAQGLTRGKGRMAAVGLGAEPIEALLEALNLETQIEIAGENSPNATTVAGDLASLELLEKALNEKEQFYHLLDLDYAFHSLQMDAIERQVLDSLASVKSSSSTVPFISAVTGTALDGTTLNADYWWKNIRQPVQFSQAVTTLAQAGTNIFVEIGPHSILRSYINDCLKSEDHTGLVMNTLKRHQDSEAHLLKSTLKILATGCIIDEEKLFPTAGQQVSLPRYPWQRETHWFPVTVEAPNPSQREREHPLLGYPVKGSDLIWENNLDTAAFPYLADHVVDDTVVLPAAAYIEMAIAASHLWANTESHHIEMVEIPVPILLEGNQSKKVRFHLDTKDGSFRICSRDRLIDEEWTQNASGRLLGRSYKNTEGKKLAIMAGGSSETISASKHYELASRVGLDYGPYFQAVTSVSAHATQAIATLELPFALEKSIEAYHLHPSLLDSGFQVLVDICKSSIESGQRKALIPIQIGSLHLLQTQANHIEKIQVDVIRHSPRSLVANFKLFDEFGLLVAELERCRFRQVQFNKALPKTVDQYQYTSQPLPLIQQWPATPLIAIDQLIQAVKRHVYDDKANANLDEYTLLVDMMVAAYAYQAVETLAGGSTFAIDALESKVAEQHNALLHQLIYILQENELLQVSEAGQADFLSADELPDPAMIWQHIIQESADWLPELMLLSQCGGQLSRLLQGEVNSDQLLRSEKSSTLQQLHEVGASYKTANDALSTAISVVVDQLPKNQLCRVLLIANYPEQLSTLLVLLLKQHAYGLTVIGEDEAKLGAVERLFQGNDAADTLVIDINSINKDGFTQPFDLIICAHSLHQIDELTSGLSILRSLLNANGLFLAIERPSDRFTDITFGVNSNWWSDQRSRLLDSEQWPRALEKSGFAEALCLTDQSNEIAQSAFLIAAQNVAEYSAPTPQTNAEVTQQKWLLVDPTGRETLNELSEQLAQDGILCQLAQSVATASENTNEAPDSNQAIDFKSFFEAHNFSKVVYVSTAETAQMSDSINTLQTLLSALEVVEDKLQLTLVTNGAVTTVEADKNLSLDPSAAALWGFGRVVMNEYPDLDCRMVDIQMQPLAKASAALINELLYADGNDEVILTSTSRHVLRMTQHDATSNTHYTSAPAVLDFKTPGSFKNLYWRETPIIELAAEQIEIQPIASGLNFRDVMYAMGLLSDEAVENGFAGPSLGMEVAGTITRVGSDVSNFNIGDEVLGFAPACFSNRVITETTATAHKPSGWSFEEAATIPAAFFTVYYALVHLAQMEEGEKILIHGASGGVGIAAIQLAHHLGLEVFATAGTPEKRAFVKNIGAHHVMDSRSLSFETEIMEITEGKGVDAVLNSVSGEAINRNLSVLKPFGRFLELGKRDFYENSRIGLRPFRNNVTYFGIDADQLLIEKKALARRLFQELMVLFEDEQLHPLPYRVYEASRIQEAFQYMQQSRHIGKVIIRLPKELPVEVSQANAKLILDGKSNYLITGGLSGFGLKTAQWLITKGAKHLTLLGRKGLMTEEAKSAVTQMEQAGIKIYTPPCDVGNRAQLEQVLKALQKDAPAIKGIIHAATVFDDALIRNLTPERVESVLNAKAIGAWNLHELTKESALDFFALYSSATTLFGNPGQANYVAANYMLENLVAYRRQHGLNACYAAWGAISDAGFLSRNKETKEGLLSRLGGSALTSAEALDELERLIASKQAGAAYINFDWKSIKRSMPSAKSPKFFQQNNELARSGGSDEIDDFATRIIGMSDDEVKKLIVSQLTREISQILRLPIEKVDQHCAIYELGMDSLMGMELLLAIEEQFAIKLPLMSLTEGGSILKIADKIQAKLRDIPSFSQNDETVESLVSKHGASLSDDEMDRLKQVNNE